jgi:S-adenosylmethionine:tRNA ribosyltransferase-isomerase
MTAPAHSYDSETQVRPTTRFALPVDRAASEPPEARGLSRDGVRLLAAVGDRIEHARFTELGQFLNPGDLLVVNTSATRAAAVDGEHTDHGAVVVHFSMLLDDGSWVVEVRTAPAAAKPIRTLEPQDRIDLPDGIRLILLGPEPADQGPLGPRLWRTQPLDPGPVHQMLSQHGRPIRYGYLAGEWPLAAYQTVFAELPGAGDPLPPSTDLGASAEMPSAGRPFSTELVTRLASRGVLFAPITLHAGVSSQESSEPPGAERFRVPAGTASLVGWTRRTGGRVIAVGTTVTRALESAADPDGTIRAADGWTDLVLGPDRPARAIDGLITGLHDPDASHLLLLEAVAGADLVQRVYDAALDQHYLWHEFGDTCLLLR